MLERTAGCLELGTLRRLLPSSKKALKSRRSLHSNFWNHGAADIELSPLWTAFLIGPESADSDTNLQHTTTEGSRVFLDFLYPSGTINLLRQCSGWRPDRLDGKRRTALGILGHRLYTSSAQDSSGEAPGGKLGAVKNAETKGILSVGQRYHSLRAILGSQDVDYEAAWSQYILLEEPGRQSVRREILGCLATSTRIVDAERVVDIFGKLQVEDKDQQAHVFAIRAYLRLQNVEGARSVFQAAAETFQRVLAADDLLAYMIDQRLWSSAIDTYADIVRIRGPEEKGVGYSYFELVNKISNLGERAVELVAYVTRKRKGSDSETLGKEIVDEFVLRIARRALKDGTLHTSKYFQLLILVEELAPLDRRRLNNDLIAHFLERKQTKLAVEIYRKFRNGASMEKGPFYDVLHSLLAVFCEHHSIVGMQEVLEDIVRYHSNVSEGAYLMCMAEFASMSDADAVHALFDRFLTECIAWRSHLKDHNRQWLLQAYTSLLQVHGKRGEIAQVIEVFEQIRNSKYELQHNIVCWNILINAYGKVHDVDSASACFEELVKSPTLRPDTTTFGTMMGICVESGDLDLTIELYRLVDQMKVEKNASMIDCLVLGHIKDDRIQQAEKICEQALTMDFEGSRTRMWNYILVGYAMTRDLDNVNRVLQRMTEAQVPYDSYTYAALMQALAIVKQPDRARAILNEVMKESGLKPNNFHYAIVMGGYIANGELGKALWLEWDMRHTPDQTNPSASTKFLTMKAKYQKIADNLEPEERRQRVFKLFLDVLSKPMDPREVSNSSQKGIQRDVSVAIAYPAMFYNYIMFVLAQSKEHETVKQLYENFVSKLPKNKVPPGQVLSAYMLSLLHNGDYAGVQECFDLAVLQAQTTGRPLRRPSVTMQDSILALVTPKPQIVPEAQLSLSRALSFYIRSLVRQKRIDDLPSVIDNLLAQGFILSNHNWNHYIQVLARRYRYKPAFELCEQHLMPGWTGYANVRWELPIRNRLPIKLRNQRKNPRHLRPKYHTLLYLGRAYLELQELAAESRASEFLLKDLQTYCPRVVHAIKTMKRTDDPLQYKIMGGR